MSETLPEGHRSGFIAVAGRPNVGKSTLINALLDQPVAAVSQRPQTTRRRQLGILTRPDVQVIFMDTPGIHDPHHKLGEWMNAEAVAAIEGADGLLVLFDLSDPPHEDDERTSERIESLASSPPVLVALNKMDLVPADLYGERYAQFESLLPKAEILPISATHGDNIDLLLQKLIDLLPEGPRYYPDAEITDAFERDIAADLIRAAALELLREEVPHCIAVRIDEYKERNDHGAYIAATLFVEKESQKGIVIGKGGSMLRRIGTKARKAIEAMSGRNIYLETRVKVLPGWRDNPEELERMGFVHGRK
jgi:GTP-binding protein Era